MGLNPTKGNMYDFCTHTWNPIKGKCPHDCAYCYMKRWGNQQPIRLVKSEFKTDLGEDNFIFIGSSCDIWAEDIPEDWIDQVIGHCDIYRCNEYLFQSKNPKRFHEYRSAFPISAILGTTIESNRIYPEMGEAPSPHERSHIMSILSRKTIVTIEPIIDFDLAILIDLIEQCRPEWVNIGANTASWIKLPEPEPSKIKELISALEEFTEVKLKKNLNRLLK